METESCEKKALSEAVSKQNYVEYKLTIVVDICCHCERTHAR